MFEQSEVFITINWVPVFLIEKISVDFGRCFKKRPFHIIRRYYLFKIVWAVYEVYSIKIGFYKIILIEFSPCVHEDVIAMVNQEPTGPIAVENMS